MEKSEHLAAFQKYIFDYAMFLTKLWGRGAFYVFQASLAMTHTSILYEVVGAVMLVIGIMLRFVQLCVRTDFCLTV